jgi:hypothetical protein
MPIYSLQDNRMKSFRHVPLRTSKYNLHKYIHYDEIYLYLLTNNAKTRSNTRHDFYVENPCGKKPRAPIGGLHYDERVTTQGIQWALFLFRAAYKMYIYIYMWWTKLTAVKYGNKSAKHNTRTVGPPDVPTKHTLRIRIISNNIGVIE